MILSGAVGAGKSTVAQVISTMQSNVKVVEIDELKIKIHGTAQRCHPPRDFPRAGRQARAYLDQGYHTIAVEAFCEQDHVRLFLDDVGRQVEASDVLYVWLGCTLDTSILRKRRVLPKATVRLEHRRYAQRYRPPGGLEIATDDVSPHDVARTLLAAWQIT
jgi:adenylate kinase family enzyme